MLVFLLEQNETCFRVSDYENYQLKENKNLY